MSLDRHLCFALYSASRAMTAAYRPVLTEMNLTYPQYLVLLVLWEEAHARSNPEEAHARSNPEEAHARSNSKGAHARSDSKEAPASRTDGRITVGRLGERLQLDSGTLSPLLKRLEANGFVRRERSLEDERQVDVTLTEAGRALERRAECIPEQLFSSTGMTEADAAELRDAVRQLTDALNASLGKEVA